MGKRKWKDGNRKFVKEKEKKKANGKNDIDE